MRDRTDDTERIRSLENAVTRLEERSKSSEEAINLAKKEIDRRLNEMNELRKQIDNERHVYVSRLEYDSKHTSTVESIGALQRIIWGATGALLAIQFVLAFALRYWKGE
jgi:hypothetical protein